MPPVNDSRASTQAIVLVFPAGEVEALILAFWGSRSCRMLIGFLSFGSGLEMRLKQALRMRVG